MKIRKPNLPLECDQLSLNSITFRPGGQMSDVAEGPSGLVLISYQNPYHSDPPDLFLRNMFYGLVTQYVATVISVYNIIQLYFVLATRLSSTTLLVSIPSSKNIACPKVL